MRDWVSNAGPDVADGAIARDTPAAGLSACAVVAAPDGCVITGGAVCRAAPGDLFSSGGVAIPTLPGDSTVTFKVRCTVD